jgi:ABC-2 type transport system permease protein
MHSPADLKTIPFVALLRREWLEHRTALIFPPAAILALVILALLFGTLFSQRITVDLDLDDEVSDAPHVQRFRPQERVRFFMASGDSIQEQGFRAMPAMATDGGTGHERRPSAQPVASVPPLEFDIDSDEVDSDNLSGLQVALTVPYVLVLLLVMMILSVSVTWDERKDRSILFWKSMPVSDTRSILAKFLFLGWITPAATIIAMLITQIIVMIVLDFHSDKNLIGYIATDRESWTALFKLLGFALYIGIWLAPFLAWGMLVGAAAPRSPTMIAILLPLLLMAIEAAVFDTRIVFGFVVTQLSLDIFSASPDGNGAAVLTYVGDKLIGLGVAALFLLTAIWSRRRCNEI